MHGARHIHAHFEMHQRWHHAGEEMGHRGPEHHPGHQGPGHRGHGPHSGPGGRRGGLHSGRKISSADLQMLLVALLEQAPAHGYELIKALDDKSHGLYVPSPGMVYPALTYLEEIGLAEVENIGTRKRYHLTEEGREKFNKSKEASAHLLSELERVGAQVAAARNDSANDGDEQGGDALNAARWELRRALFRDAAFTTEQVEAIAQILRKAAAEIRSLFASSESNNG